MHLSFLKQFLFKMTFFFIILFLPMACALKTWIPNTDISNKFNWDKEDLPRNCDKILFPIESEVGTFWDLKVLVITEMSLPRSGDIIFSDDVEIHFIEEKNCSNLREITYIRNDLQSWLNPFNWQSDSEFQWLPHSQRVPCAGENIIFPAQRTFGIQLPTVLLPLGAITFDNEGEQWVNFLKSELGYRLFSGPEDIRSLPWRDDIGCPDNNCICSRSAYTIRNGQYKETNSAIFEEAVCLYAMPKCEPAECYFPVIPEGHCCGICGAIINLENETKNLEISIVESKVKKELKEFGDDNFLKVYVGNTKIGGIQIVIIANESEYTIKSHILASIIKRKLLGEHYFARVSSHNSGLTFSNYVFNSISGVVFGTLFAVIIFLLSIYYIYTILPKKKFQKLNVDKSFRFARFENTLNGTSSEENLQINVDSEISENKSQAFDNPIYSGNPENFSSEPKDSQCLRTISEISNIEVTEIK